MTRIRAVNKDERNSHPGAPGRPSAQSAILIFFIPADSKMRIAFLILIAVGLAAAVPGCSRSAGVTPIAVVRAGGTLTWRGQPVVEAVLTFQGDNESEAAFAMTDANGNFQCMTNDSNAGLPPGEYVVTVSSPRDGIPAKYAAAETSPLSVTVEDGGENAFALVLEE